MIAEPVGLDLTSTFLLKVGKQPGIDLTTIDHSDDSRLYTKAIYQLDGDVLTYCVAAPSQDRPTELKTRHGDGNTLVVLRRGSP